MIDDLFEEIRDILILGTIIAYVVLAADIYDRIIFWNEIYRDWTVNEDCDSGNGFYDAMVRGKTIDRKNHLSDK